MPDNPTRSVCKTWPVLALLISQVALVGCGDDISIPQTPSETATPGGVNETPTGTAGQQTQSPSGTQSGGTQTPGSSETQPQTPAVSPTPTAGSTANTPASTLVTATPANITPTPGDNTVDVSTTAPGTTPVVGTPSPTPTGGSGPTLTEPQVTEPSTPTTKGDQDGDGFTADADCDDGDNSIYPGAQEVCDNKDNDCNDLIDDDDSGLDLGSAQTWYQDVDEDGYGHNDSTITACEAPDGYVGLGNDCDDGSTDYYPGAPEGCTDDVDYNCDGSIGFTDSDGDGVPACEDCDDTNAAVYPEATEVCDPDNVDENCNGYIDNSDTGTDPASKTTFYPDNDLDGFGDENHPGALFCDAPNGYVAEQGDCNDQLDSVNPDASEVCNDGDDDCDGQVDDDDDSVDLTNATIWYEDADSDGYGDTLNGAAACERPTGTVSDDSDCNDQNASVYPNANETCDGVDNDCDNTADEGAPTSTWYADGDNDGYGLDGQSTQACGQPDGYAVQGGDCNDDEPSINPGATETCDENNVDENCNNTADNSDLTTDPDSKTRFWPDEDGDGYADDDHPGGLYCDAPNNYAGEQGDCDDDDPDINPGASEQCNNIDDDCDTLVDQDDDSLDPSSQTTWYQDNDGDLYGDDLAATSSCDRPANYVAQGGDCDDDNGDINPDASEACNGVNDDCDLEIDEGVEPATWYQDNDSDGYGIDESTSVACEQPSGYANQAGDCNDGNANVNPGQSELCNGVDDNCAGGADDGLDFVTYYADSDGDDFGDSSNSVSECEQPDGYVTDQTDCNDDDSSVYPEAAERCNFSDDDCDSVVDEDSEPTTWYADGDDDGFGSSSDTSSSCEQPDGYVANDDDCNDGNGAINPSATELCDTVDNNCNGATDEDSAEDATDWYADTDGDGYGNSAGGSTTACYQPDGYAASDDDCNDNNGDINPGQDEECDFIDNDCDSIADEDLEGLETFYVDNDGDGFGDINEPVESCSICPECSENSTDCDDSRDDVYPGATEYLDGIDNDCDNAIETNLSAAAAQGGFVGVSSGGRVGHAVDFIGDFDNDGFDDIAVGAPRMNSRSGAVYVIYGRENGWEHSVISQAGIAINGTAVEAEFGFSLTGGDLDNDGIGDLAIGAPQADVNNGITRNGGSISVTYGSSERLSADGNVEDIEDTFSDGYFDEVQLGYSMDAHGDMNGDGIDDLLIGAPWYYITMDPPAGGYIFVLPGQLSQYGGVFGIEGNQFYHFKGEGSQVMGINTVHVGDVDNNGFSDWLGIGLGDVSTGILSSDEDCGMSYLVQGTYDDNLGLGSDSAMYVQDFTQSKYYGDDDNQLIGESAAKLGDFNNDGIADFALGRAAGGTDDALAYVFLGGTPMPSEGEVQNKASIDFVSNSGMTCPCTVGGLGDINSDGIDDFAVGVTEATGGGKVFLFYGETLSRGGAPYEITLESDADHIITGENSGDLFGSDIAGMGDVNGDSIDDFIIGAWGVDSNAGNEVGKAYLFLGY